MTELPGANAPAFRAPLHIAVGRWPEYMGGGARTPHDLAVTQRRYGLASGLLTVGERQEQQWILTPATPTDSLLSRMIKIGRGSRRSLYKYDLLDIHFALYGAPVILGGLGQQLPTITHFHGPWYAESDKPGSFIGQCRKLLEYLTYRTSQRFIVHTSAFRAVLMRSFGIPSDIIDIIPPGLADEWFNDTEQVDAANVMAGRGVYICAVRRLVPRTGIADLVEAMRLLPSSISLAVIGSGPERERIEAWSLSNGLQSRVHFLGSLPDVEMRAVLRGAALAVVPTRALEGFGLAVIEALAVGTPVVATRVGGLIEVMRNFPSCLAAPRNVADLAATILRVLSAPPSRAACRAAASEYRWGAVHELTLAAYSRVASGC